MPKMSDQQNSGGRGGATVILRTQTMEQSPYLTMYLQSQEAHAEALPDDLMTSGCPVMIELSLELSHALQNQQFPARERHHRR